jgi:hypothetical protein
MITFKKIRFLPLLIIILFIFYSGIFHFATLDYFRHKDESSNDESDKESEEEEKGNFVAGGVYAPPAAQSISIAAAGLTFSIAVAAGFRNLVTGGNKTDESNKHVNKNEQEHVAGE